MSESIDESAEQKLTVTDEENRLVVRIALLCTLYFEDAHLWEVREKVTECFEEYQALCGAHLRWVKHPVTYRWHRIGSSSVPSLGDWLQKLDRDDALEFEFHGGEDEYAASHFGVSVLGSREWQRRLSYFKAVLPITWFADHPGNFPSFALSFYRKLHPVSGYGGLGIIESPSATIQNEYEPTVFRIAQRFPGLEVDYPYGHVLHLDKGIKGINWLTVLGERWLAEVGGISALGAKLCPEFVFREFPGGILIQAGPRPHMGDLAQNRLPGLYFQLNSVLKPIRIKAHYPFHHAGEGRFDKEASERWLARFDH